MKVVISKCVAARQCRGHLGPARQHRAPTRIGFWLSPAMVCRDKPGWRDFGKAERSRLGGCPQLAGHVRWGGAAIDYIRASAAALVSSKPDVILVIRSALKCDAAGSPPNSRCLHRDLRSGRTWPGRKPRPARRQSQRIYAYEVRWPASWWSFSRRWHRMLQGWLWSSTPRTSVRRATGVRYRCCKVPRRNPRFASCSRRRQHPGCCGCIRARAEWRPSAPDRRDDCRASRFDRRAGGAASVARGLLISRRCDERRTDAVGPDTADLFVRSASYVDRILRGEKPSELPVQRRRSSFLQSTSRPQRRWASKYRRPSCCAPTR